METEVSWTQTLNMTIDVGSRLYKQKQIFRLLEQSVIIGFVNSYVQSESSPTDNTFDILLMVGDLASNSVNNVSWIMHVWESVILHKLFMLTIKQYSFTPSYTRSTNSAWS
jgi:hypothetical protein